VSMQNRCLSSLGTSLAGVTHHSCCHTLRLSPPATQTCGGASVRVNSSTENSVTRRTGLLGLGAVLVGDLCLRSAASLAVDQSAKKAIEDESRRSYARRDFNQTLELVDELVREEPEDARYHEMRAAVRVDDKKFSLALEDYDKALDSTPGDALVERARLLAGRALAHEGLSDWQAALDDYDLALSLAARGGQYPDPYVLNSKGNVLASLGRWKEARQDYLRSAAGFQKAAGFKDRDGSSASRLDGAIVASSNAALALVQLGDEPAAIKEMQKASRRAPGSVDLRAALAGLYWAQGKEAAAESEWNFACDRISVGCSRYTDKDWLARIRRWPPRMVERMEAFLALASSKQLSVT
ncbi:hypothetical protein CVIRNUC_008490, partial [Coccomyxa viridis]